MDNARNAGPQESKPRRLLGHDVDLLAARHSLSTAEEIVQQPGIWRKTEAMIEFARSLGKLKKDAIYARLWTLSSVNTDF